MWYNGVGNYLTTFCMLIFVSFQTESILLLAIPKGNEHLQYQKDLVFCLLTYQKSLWLIIPTWLSPNILSITCHSKRALSHLLFQKDHHLPFQKGAVSPAIPKGPSPAIPKGPCLPCLSKRVITCHSKRAITCHSKRALSPLPFQKGPVSPPIQKGPYLTIPKGAMTPTIQKGPSPTIPKGPCLTCHSKRALSPAIPKWPYCLASQKGYHLSFQKDSHLQFQKGHVTCLFKKTLLLAILKGTCYLPFQNDLFIWFLSHLPFQKCLVTWHPKLVVTYHSKWVLSPKSAS